MKLFYDFETTGLPNFRAPSSEPSQPHIVQAAAILVDGEDIVSSFDLISKPVDWEIPDEAAKIHGITTKIAAARGVSERDVVTILHDLWKRSSLRIAHNESFDARIMRIALFRFFDKLTADAWKSGEAFCTCNTATPIVQMPATQKMIDAGMGSRYKKASLSESYLAATGKELVDAHSTMPDVLACREVYEWVISQ